MCVYMYIDYYVYVCVYIYICIYIYVCVECHKPSPGHQHGKNGIESQWFLGLCIQVNLGSFALLISDAVGKITGEMEMK